VTRALTVSYVMVESILDVMALIILGGVHHYCSITIGRGRAKEGTAVENNRMGLNWESNNCQMLNSSITLITERCC
jgi:hypothetical protein